MLKINRIENYIRRKKIYKLFKFDNKKKKINM